jgi:hypothetical protein
VQLEEDTLEPIYMTDLDMFVKHASGDRLKEFFGKLETSEEIEERAKK